MIRIILRLSWYVVAGLGSDPASTTQAQHDIRS